MFTISVVSVSMDSFYGYCFCGHGYCFCNYCFYDNCCRRSTFLCLASSAAPQTKMEDQMKRAVSCKPVLAFRKNISPLQTGKSVADSGQGKVNL